MREGERKRTRINIKWSKNANWIREKCFTYKWQMYLFAQCQYHIAATFAFLWPFLIFAVDRLAMQLHATAHSRWYDHTEVNFGRQIPNSVEILSFGSFVVVDLLPFPLSASLLIFPQLSFIFSDYFTSFRKLYIMLRLVVVGPPWNCHFLDCSFLYKLFFSPPTRRVHASCVVYLFIVLTRCVRCILFSKWMCSRYERHFIEWRHKSNGGMRYNTHTHTPASPFETYYRWMSLLFLLTHFNWLPLFRKIQTCITFLLSIFGAS